MVPLCIAQGLTDFDWFFYGAAQKPLGRSTVDTSRDVHVHAPRLSADWTWIQCSGLVAQKANFHLAVLNDVVVEIFASAHKMETNGQASDFWERDAEDAVLVNLEGILQWRAARQEPWQHQRSAWTPAVDFPAESV